VKNPLFGSTKSPLSVKTAFINPSTPEVNPRIQFLPHSELNASRLRRSNG